MNQLNLFTPEIEFNHKSRGCIYTDKIWKELYKMTATPSLYQWQITKHLRNEIPEIF